MEVNALTTRTHLRVLFFAPVYIPYHVVHADRTVTLFTFTDVFAPLLDDAEDCTPVLLRRVPMLEGVTAMTGFTHAYLVDEHTSVVSIPSMVRTHGSMADTSALYLSIKELRSA